MKFTQALSIAVLLCAIHGTKGESEEKSSAGLVRLESAKRFRCLGMLIDEEWIVASASCVSRGVDTVVLKHCRNEEDKICEKPMPVDRVITHPHWDGEAKDDIALVQIAERAEGAPQMKIANRGRERLAASMNSQCYAMDWNKRSGMDKQMVKMRWLDCNRQFTGFDIEDPMCSVGKQGDCKRAEGTPTICMVGKRTYLFGIHAVKKAVRGGCYNALTRVSRYLPWIRNVMHSVDKTDVPLGARCLPPHRGGQDPCIESAKCMPGFYSHRCQCLDRYHEQDGVCVYGGGDVGGECTSRSTCWDPNAECDNVTATCVCPEKYHDKDGVCVYTRHRVGQGCFEDSDCEKGLYCKTEEKGKFCYCRKGYAGVDRKNLPLNESCQKCADDEHSDQLYNCYSKKGKGYSCSNDPFDSVCEEWLGGCKPEIGDTRGRNWKCQCNRTSKYDGDSCVPCPTGQLRSDTNDTTCIPMVRLGENCTAHEQCTEGALCTSSTCTCHENFVTTPQGECIKAGRKSGAACETGDICQSSLHLSCVDGECVCNEGYRNLLGNCQEICPNSTINKCYNYGEFSGYGCVTELCAGNGICGYSRNNDDLEMDEHCGVDYASECLADEACMSGVGLICGRKGLCECEAGLQWTWSEQRCVVDGR